MKNLLDSKCSMPSTLDDEILKYSDNNFSDIFLNYKNSNMSPSNNVDVFTMQDMIDMVSKNDILMSILYSPESEITVGEVAYVACRYPYLLRYFSYRWGWYKADYFTEFRKVRQLVPVSIKDRHASLMWVLYHNDNDFFFEKDGKDNHPSYKLIEEYYRNNLNFDTVQNFLQWGVKEASLIQKYVVEDIDIALIRELHNV